jgi:hypothetical protein
MRFVRTVGLMTSLLLLSALPSAAQSVEGTWIFSLTSPDGPVEMEVQFQHEGDEVKGSAEHEMADAIEISDGKLEANVLTFIMHVGMQGQWFSVEMTATVEGDQMTGEATLAEMGSMPFSATKAGGG